MIEHEVWPVHDELVRKGALAPAALGGDDERAWLDCDLASLAENWLGERLDPRELDEARRRDWQSRALEEPAMPLARRTKYERCYWLLDGGERKGTMALATGTLGGSRLYLASFYVYPPYRGDGVGRRAMARLTDALGRHGLGLKLDTSWCWQRTVRFYLSAGLWVRMWKRDLELCWDPGTPAPILTIGDETATLSVAIEGRPTLLARARRRGDVLELDQPAKALSSDERLGEACWHADGTLALGLALRGWPLVRSPEQWARSYHADGGPPEALAYKITLWEAWARKRGWTATTPRIPAMVYPTWEEFEAMWAADRRAFERGDPGT
ncbi:MAG: GNAT family N-acetyltransferase [Byssovorax sp.]